jgi:DNA-binding MarR family transcriptional regulator
MHRQNDLTVRAALDSLRRIVRALRLSASDIERRAGISVAQLFVLQRLSDGRPRSLVELAAETLTDPSSVSSVVRRLVDAKLVARTVSESDSRRAQLTLTAAGKRLVARVPEAPQSRLMQALTELPSRRLSAVATGLEHVARALDAGDATLFFEDEAAPGRRAPAKRGAHGRS